MLAGIAPQPGLSKCMPVMDRHGLGGTETRLRFSAVRNLRLRERTGRVQLPRPDSSERKRVCGASPVPGSLRLYSLRICLNGRSGQIARFERRCSRSNCSMTLIRQEIRPSVRLLSPWRISVQEEGAQLPPGRRPAFEVRDSDQSLSTVTTSMKPTSSKISMICSFT